MPARTGCCVKPMNLQKMDPATGAIIWQAAVLNSLNIAAHTPSSYRVDPIHTTNDILVSVNDRVSATPTVNRVDSTGVVLWSITSTGGGAGGGSWVNTRLIGSDSMGTALLVFGGAFGSPILRAYAVGSGPPAPPIWSVTFSGNVSSFAISGTTAVVTAASSTGAYELRSIDTTTGATIASTGGVSALSVPMVQAIDSSGNFICYMQWGGIFAPTNATVFTAPQITVATATYRGGSMRFGGSGYSSASFTDTPIAAIGTSGTSVTPLFNLTSIGGATFVNLFDTCNDATGYYFCGRQMTGAGSVKFSIFKASASGGLIWASKFGKFPTSNADVYGICLSDDGYLYAAGGWLAS